MRTLSVVGLLLLAGCGERSVTLRLGSPPEEPGPTIAAIVAASLAEAGMDVSLAYYESTEELLAALERGELELGLVEEPTEARGTVTTVVPLYPSVLHVLVREPPVGTLDEALRGRVYAGPPGSAGFRLARDLAAELGIGDVRLLDNPWTEAPDTYFVFGGLLPREAMKQLAEFSLLDLDGRHATGESTVDAMALKHPTLRPFILPAGLYPTLGPDAARTVATTTLLAAADTLDEAIVYRITQRLSENARPLRSAYPLANANVARNMDPDSFALPLHAGARRYMSRELPGFVERHVDIIALVTTLLLAGVSAAAGWAHSSRRARKERIDRFLTDLLEIRAALPTEPPAQVGRLDLVEKTVLELVVAEKIEVDAGLVAFLQLATSIRAQMLQRNAMAT